MIYTEDFINFSKVYGRGIPLVVYAFNKQIVEILKNLGGIFLLDTPQIMSKILQQLNYHFKDAAFNMQLHKSVDFKETALSF